MRQELYRSVASLIGVQGVQSAHRVSYTPLSSSRRAAREWFPTYRGTKGTFLRSHCAARYDTSRSDFRPGADYEGTLSPHRRDQRLQREAMLGGDTPERPRH